MKYDIEEVIKYVYDGVTFETKEGALVYAEKLEVYGKFVVHYETSEWSGFSKNYKTLKGKDIHEIVEWIEYMEEEYSDIVLESKKHNCIFVGLPQLKQYDAEAYSKENKIELKHIKDIYPEVLV